MNGQDRWTRSREIQQTRTNRNDSLVEKRKSTRKPVTRPHETEEEAIIRRFHDAQRMARFRAKKKKALEAAKALEASKLSEVDIISELKRRNVLFHVTSKANDENLNNNEKRDNFDDFSTVSESKYSQLLSVIEELGKDVKLSYAGSRNSAEKLKNGIVHARSLVRDCLLETEINSRQ